MRAKAIFLQTPGLGMSTRAFDLVPDERSAMEQRARVPQRIASLGEMTGGIVQGFMSILAAVESDIRFAERKLDEPEKAHASLARARKEILRGMKLTSQLSTFAKQLKLDARVEDANDYLKNLEPLLKYGAGPKTRILLDLSPDAAKCLFDPVQLNAAIFNLVINARDAMPNGGEMRISTERLVIETDGTSSSPAPGTYVRLRVKDTGKGMSAEVARRAFDPFFTTKGEGGTGLGLPQVHAFMRLIGGGVSVVSELGVGTTVDLLFPSNEPNVIEALSS